MLTMCYKGTVAGRLCVLHTDTKGQSPLVSVLTCSHAHTKVYLVHLNEILLDVPKWWYLMSWDESGLELLV